MNKSKPAANPDAYVAALDGWRRDLVEHLRKHVRVAARLEEVVKWGHLVYLSNGPVLLIRAERERVLFGFWRGQHLTAVEPRLRPSGMYDMATLELHDGDAIKATTVRRLAHDAAELNATSGDPTKVAKRARRKHS